MITHLYNVAILVADCDRALAFYRDALDFEVTADVTDTSNPNNRWLTIKPRSSQTNLMLLKRMRSEDGTESHRPSLLTFATSDINADCERIKSHGGAVIHPPKRAGWGNALETHFSDPDGNVFMLIQQI